LVVRVLDEGRGHAVDQREGGHREEGTSVLHLSFPWRRAPPTSHESARPNAGPPRNRLRRAAGGAPLRGRRRRRFGGGLSAQVRSALRPKKPCGRKKMMSRNTTKMAVFCSCVGSTRVDSCCTNPMVSPPQKAPMMLPMPPSTTPAYITMTYSRPTKGWNG